MVEGLPDPALSQKAVIIWRINSTGGKIFGNFPKSLCSSHLSRPAIDLQHANHRDVLHMDPNKPNIVPSRAAHLGPELTSWNVMGESS